MKLDTFFCDCFIPSDFNQVMVSRIFLFWDVMNDDVNKNIENANKSKEIKCDGMMKW